MQNWLFLFLAIIFEVVGTSVLKATDGFTRLGPSVLAVSGYITAFYFLSLTLRSIPVGIAYALWSGIGIVLIAFIGWCCYGQKLDAPAVFGLGLILAGVLVINLLSKSVNL